MPTWPHLPNAPIAEALIDIRVELPDSVNLDTLARFHDGLEDRYPNRRERYQWATKLEVKGGETPSIEAPSGGVDGYFFDSADAKQIAQARLDGFTFSRLKPYQTWNQLKTEAADLWEHYRTAAQPRAITRIAVRYINRIELPKPISNLRCWILTAPEVPATLPQGLAGFVMRLAIPFEDPDARAIITETIDTDSPPDRIALILDIDVFRDDRMECEAPDLWAQFEQLRAVKNRVFFESITRATEELFR